MILVNPTTFQHKFDITLKTSCDVTSINREEKTVDYLDLKSMQTLKIPYDYLVLAPGIRN